MTRRTIFICTIVVVFASLLSSPTTVTATTQTAWTIILGTQASSPETIAASNVQKVLGNNSNSVHIKSEPAAIEDLPKEGKIILLGTPNSNHVLKAFLSAHTIKLPEGSPDSYVVKSIADKTGAFTVVLASEKPIGLLYAANDLIDNFKDVSHLDISMKTPLRVRGVQIWKDYLDGATWDGFYPRNWASYKYPFSFEEYVDFLLKYKINTLVVGPYFFRPMSYVDYKKTPYPEAQQFSEEQVALWRSNAEKHLKYAHDRGFQILFHSYEHNAPASFYKSHEDTFNPGGRFTKDLDSRGGLTVGPKRFNVVQNMSWNNPLYRKFWIDSQRELLKTLPGLDGFFATYGEWTKSYEGAPRVENIIDYIKTNQQLLKETRGDDSALMVRDWYININEWLDPRMPRVPIVNKFSGFDAGPVEPAPWPQQYIKAGFPVMYQEMIRHAENTDPLIWADVDFSRLRMENLKKTGAMGMILEGIAGEPSEDLNFKASAAAFWNGPQFTEADAIATLRKYYGDAAPHVYAFMKNSAFAMTEYTKIASGRRGWWQSDGVGIQAITTGFRALDSFRDPLDYVRQNAVGMPDYVNSLLADKAKKMEMEAAWKQQGLLTPEQILASIDNAAQVAEREILEARRLAPDSPYMQEMVASSIMLKYVAPYYRAYVEAALEYFILEKQPGQADRKAHMKALLEKAAENWEQIFYLGQTFFPGEIEERFHSLDKQYKRQCEQMGITYDKEIKLDQDVFAREMSRILFNSEDKAPLLKQFKSPLWQIGQIDGLTLLSEMDGVHQKQWLASKKDLKAVNYVPGKTDAMSFPPELSREGVHTVTVDFEGPLPKGGLLRVALLPESTDGLRASDRGLMRVSLDGKDLATINSPVFFHSSEQRVLSYIFLPASTQHGHSMKFEWIGARAGVIDGIELLN